MERKEKKVLHLLWGFGYGGTSLFVLNMLENINKGYHFDFAVCGQPLDGEKDERLKTSNIYHLPKIEGKKGKKSYLHELEKVLKNGKYDIVHSHLAFMNISALKLAKKYGVKCRISHIHIAGSGNRNSVLNTLKRFLINFYSTTCIACSKLTADFYYGKSSKTKILYSGIDTKRFLCYEEKKNNNFIILGRICAEKNPYFIANLVNEIHSIKPEFTFTWCGDGELRNKIEAYCNERKIKINFVGSVNNPEEYLRNAAFMLLPSTREGFGMAAIEAQLSNVFVFASNCVPKDTDLGLIEYFPLDSEKNWAKKIITFMDSDCRNKCSLDSNLIGNYDIKNITNEIVKIYNLNR